MVARVETFPLFLKGTTFPAQAIWKHLYNDNRLYSHKSGIQCREKYK